MFRFETSSQRLGVCPFEAILNALGTTFQVQMQEPNFRVELIFRYLYIYHKKYQYLPDGDLLFMNECDLDDFDKV